jgi:membrane associated rhomboid family serine protease
MVFVHVDFWHIFGNMLLLYFFGRIVYRMMGGWKFLIIYFVGGVVGNLLYLSVAEQLSFAWGASGAVYAIAGALVVMVPNMRINLYFLIPVPLWVFVIVFLGILSIPPFAPYGIAWMAHLGGLAVGLIAGFIYRRQMRHIIYR